MGGALFSCGNLIFIANRAHTNAGVRMNAGNAEEKATESHFPRRAEQKIRIKNLRFALHTTWIPHSLLALRLRAIHPFIMDGGRAFPLPQPITELYVRYYGVELPHQSFICTIHRKYLTLGKQKVEHHWPNRLAFTELSTSTLTRSAHIKKEFHPLAKHSA